MNGGLLYFYAAGTTTPQSAYQDSSLTIAWPNPIVLDSAGRVPPFYLADGQIKIILRNSAGVTQVSADNLLVVGASSGSGSAPSVDATTIFDTGDIKCKYSTSSITGWVRSNGRTIGSATSGGTERANADCEDLFLFLWATDSNLSVSTGRGASAAADWAANKTIALPDWRGRALAGLDDMGNTAAGRLTSTYFGTAATVLGAAGGTESHTLTTAQLATHSHGVTDPGHFHSTAMVGNVGVSGSPAAGNSGSSGSAGTDTKLTGITINNAGSGNAHNNVQPSMLATIYLKL